MMTEEEFKQGVGNLLDRMSDEAYKAGYQAGKAERKTTPSFYYSVTFAIVFLIALSLLVSRGM